MKDLPLFSVTVVTDDETGHNGGLDFTITAAARAYIRTNGLEGLRLIENTTMQVLYRLRASVYECEPGKSA